MEIIEIKDIDFKGIGKNSVEKRDNLRKQIIKLFGEEQPGTGNKDKASRYEYIFEDIYYNNDKYNIYIDRPANLHNRI